MTEIEVLEYYQKAWDKRHEKPNHSLAGHAPALRTNAEYAAMSKGYVKRGYAGNAPAPNYITDKGILRLEQLRHEETKAELAAAKEKLADWKFTVEEIVQALGMRLVDGELTYSDVPDFRWDAIRQLAKLMKSA